MVFRLQNIKKQTLSPLHSGGTNYSKDCKKPRKPSFFSYLQIAVQKDIFTQHGSCFPGVLTFSIYLHVFFLESICFESNKDHLYKLGCKMRVAFSSKISGPLRHKGISHLYCCDIGQTCIGKRCQDDIFPRIELIPSFVLSSDNTNCKNDIQ